MVNMFVVYCSDCSSEKVVPYLYCYRLHDRSNCLVPIRYTIRKERVILYNRFKYAIKLFTDVTRVWTYSLSSDLN